MVEEGVDFSDQQAVADWIASFNRRDRSERDAVLGDLSTARFSELDHTDDLFSDEYGTDDETDENGDDVFTIVMPTEDTARASASQSPLLAQIHALVAFIGEGRKTTQTGALTLADARTLVTLLGTKDRIDAMHAGKVFKTRSAADLPQLSFIMRVATAARFVRVVKGKLTSTKAGRSLGRQPLDELGRLITGIDDVGVVTARLANNGFVWGSLAPYFDNMFVDLCIALLTSESGVAFADAVNAAFEQFQAEIDIDNPYWTEDFRRRVVEHEIRAAIETLEAAGTVTWIGYTTSETWAEPTNGTVATTPAGQWVLSRHLSEYHGVPFVAAKPVRFSSLSFEALVDACKDDTDLRAGDVMRELAAWVAQRGDDALADLIATVRSTSDTAIRQMALAALGEHFGSRAETAVRELLDVDRLRASALLWLVHSGAEASAVLLDPDPAVFSETLNLVLFTEGPKAMLELFEGVGQHDEQIAAINRLWRMTTPTSGPVLAALGRLHPVKAVAKAARKAALQHTSFAANLRP